MPRTEKMVALAKEYCRLIEQAVHDCPPTDWLDAVAALLPRINAAVTALDVDAQIGVAVKADMEGRFEVYSRLRDLLGEMDAYWLEFDHSGDDDCRSGSLADDLTDIYCELKSGLELMVGLEQDARGVRQIAATWRETYRDHWGRHILDAQRHLMELSVLG